MKFVPKVLKRKVISVYLNNPGESYPIPENYTDGVEYVPLNQFIELKPNGDIKMCYTTTGKANPGIHEPFAQNGFVNRRNISRDIEAYDPGSSTKKLSDQVANAKRYRITDGDVVLGGNFVVFNGTKRPVTIIGSNNISKTFFPIVNDKLSLAFEGKVIIYEIQFMDTPVKRAKATPSVDNYLKQYIEHYGYDANRPKTNNQKIADTLMIYKHASDAWDYFQSKQFTGDIPDMKVVLASTIDARDLVDSEGKEDVCVFYSNTDMLIGYSKDFIMTDNPAVEKTVTQDDLEDNYNSDMPLIYINDPNDEVSARWFYFFNRCYEISKKKDRFQNPGLYIGTQNGKGTFVEDKYFTLEELKDLNILYKTKEEAMECGDRHTVLEREIKSRELGHRLEGLDLQNENARIQRATKEIEKEALRQKALTAEMSEELAKAKHARDTQSLNNQAAFDLNNHHLKDFYERRRFERADIRDERDSTIEALKFGVAGAGVVLAFLALMGKFSKAA